MMMRAQLSLRACPFGRGPASLPCCPPAHRLRAAAWIPPTLRVCIPKCSTDAGVALGRVAEQETEGDEGEDEGELVSADSRRAWLNEFLAPAPGQPDLPEARAKREQKIQALLDMANSQPPAGAIKWFTLLRDGDAAEGRATLMLMLTTQASPEWLEEAWLAAVESCPELATAMEREEEEEEAELGYEEVAEDSEEKRHAALTAVFRGNWVSSLAGQEWDAAMEAAMVLMAM